MFISLESTVGRREWCFKQLHRNPTASIYLLANHLDYNWNSTQIMWMIFSRLMIITSINTHAWFVCFGGVCLFVFSSSSVYNPSISISSSKSDNQAHVSPLTTKLDPHPFYLWSLRCVQYEVGQLFEHLIEGKSHVVLWQQLHWQVGQQTGGQLSVAGLSFQGQGHSQGGELKLMGTQVELLQ